MKALQLGPAAALAAIALSACGGTGGGAAPPAGKSLPATAPVRTTATLSLFIPNKGTSSALRAPSFISPSSKTLSIGAQPPGAYFGVTTNVAIGAGAPGCTSVSGGVSCTVAFGALAGSNTLSFVIYDQPPANLNSANPLSQATLTANIAPDATTNVSTTLAGIVGNVATTPAAVAFKKGTASQVTLNVQGLDGDNNVISGNFDAPVTVTTTDTTGAISVSPASLSGQNLSVQVSYNGSTAFSSANLNFASSDQNVFGYPYGLIAQVPIAAQ